MRACLGWLAQVLAWLVILGVTGMLAVAVLLPRLAGATPYAVLTGSMRPDYPPGTLVVVRPVRPDEIRTGDVITYQLESGKPTVVTHRVTRVSGSLGGGTTYTTRGDANDVADEKPVRPVQVKGRLWYSVPYLGYASGVLTGRQHQLLVYLVGGGLVAYAAAMFAGAARDRHRSATAGEPATPRQQVAG